MMECKLLAHLHENSKFCIPHKQTLELKYNTLNFTRDFKKAKYTHGKEDLLLVPSILEIYLKIYSYLSSIYILYWERSV